MIQVGQKVRFNPFTANRDSVQKIEIRTTGTVVWINERHQWFSVQYGENQRTSFKFSEIGQNVHLCKK